jgi:hypothetical protein
MWWRLIALVVPLGIDSFVVLATLGLQGLWPSAAEDKHPLRLLRKRHALVGPGAGRPLAAAVRNAADYLAFGVLSP